MSPVFFLCRFPTGFLRRQRQHGFTRVTQNGTHISTIRRETSASRKSSNRFAFAGQSVMPRGVASGTVLAVPMHRQRCGPRSRSVAKRTLWFKAEAASRGAYAAGGRRVTDASDINASARRESGYRRGNTIVRTSRGCRRKEVKDMNRRIVSSPAASHEVPARLPVQTEDLTAGQTARISGGDAGLGRLIRNLVAEIFGVTLPEPDRSSRTL